MNLDISYMPVCLLHGKGHQHGL